MSVSDFINIRKYDKVMLKTAILWSDESTCRRNKVGTVIANEGRIISIGYNGTVSGSDNDCEITCTICNGDRVIDNASCSKCNGKGIITNPTTIHSEANAILFAVKNGIKLNNTILYVTKSPCIECAKMIVQSGISRVVYIDEYKDMTGVEFLKQCNVAVVHIPEDTVVNSDA